jgi:hypothetical protein
MRLFRGLALTLLLVPAALHAQDASLQAGLRVTQLRAEPAEVRVTAGQKVAFRVVALDAQGNVVEGAALRVTARRGGDGAVNVANDSVAGLVAGTNEIVATVVVPPDAGRAPVELRVPVVVSWPRVGRITIETPPGRLYAGTTLRHRAAVAHADGSIRPGAQVRWTSSDESVATVDRFGFVTAHRPGTVDITAELEGVRSTERHTVAALTAERLDITVSGETVRTGDVVDVAASVRGAGGTALADVPVTWSFTFTPTDSIRAPGAAGLIEDGRFVAEVPGRYTLLATAGRLSARRTVVVEPRRAVRTVEAVGHGPVTHVHTSDLWVYEGVDGRDYAVTGTWGAAGWAYFWDVTDPANIAKLDSIHVDARTVNDVKVAPNGRYAALSREGASNRRNGVVLIDLSNPRDPEIAANYDDGLTGGVHNMFATDDYLFALSGGDKYVILDVRDIRDPKYVSEYNHTSPNGERSSIHDVWVHDGIAYSSEWQNGVVVVDVGNGKYGGSIESPKFVTAIPYPVGRTHAAFPYFQQSTGKAYLFLGDEIIGRRGAAWAGGLPNEGEKGGTPEVTSGYIHVIDFTDPLNPKDVARYEVKEFGTHNLWVEDDILFQAYYEGGTRMLDVSGELLGDLAGQGREIAVFKSYDPDGFIANAPMVWGAQPYKGHIFMADHYSGLWAVKMSEASRRTN